MADMDIMTSPLEGMAQVICGSFSPGPLEGSMQAQLARCPRKQSLIEPLNLFSEIFSCSLL